MLIQSSNSRLSSANQIQEEKIDIKKENEIYTNGKLEKIKFEDTQYAYHDTSQLIEAIKAISLLSEECENLYNENSCDWLPLFNEHLLQAARYYAMQGDFNQSLQFIEHYRQGIRWMIEESQYLLQYADNELAEKRSECKEQLAQCQCFEEAIQITQNDGQEQYLDNIVKKLKQSHFLAYSEQAIGVLRYFTLCCPTLYVVKSNELIEILILLQQYDLIEPKAIAGIGRLIKQQTDWFDKQNDLLITSPIVRNKFHTSAMRIMGAAFLLQKKYGGIIDDEALYGARMVRFLAESGNNDNLLLASRGLAILTREYKINDNFNWNDLRIGNPNTISQSILKFCDDKTDSVQKKELIYESERYAIFLDNNKFTLVGKQPGSANIPTIADTIKIVSDQLDFGLNKGLANKTSFTSINNYRHFWDTLIADCPANASLQTAAPQPTDEELPKAECPLKKGEAAFLRITGKTNNALLVEVDDKDYPRMSGILYFNQISPAYQAIENFSEWFQVHDILTANVLDENLKSFTIAKEMNDELVADLHNNSVIKGMVTSTDSYMIYWLLETGASCCTPRPNGFKPEEKAFYNLTYKGFDSKGNIRITINHPYTKQQGDDYANVLHELLRGYMQECAQKWYTQKGPAKTEVQATPAPAEVEPSTNHIIDGEQTIRELIRSTELISAFAPVSIERYNQMKMLELLSVLINDRQRQLYYRACAQYIYLIALIAEKESAADGCDDIISLADSFDQMFELINSIHGQLPVEQLRKMVAVLQVNYKEASPEKLYAFIQSEDQTVSRCARYLSILLLLSNEETEQQEIFQKKLKELLGLHVEGRKQQEVFYFGTEGYQREFKTSAYESADKGKTEQSLVLARTLAAFMNTDGGTLYIGVNDDGYRTGMNSDLRYTTQNIDKLYRYVAHNVLSLLGEGDEWKSLQDKVRYEFMGGPADDRIVLAFRVPPMQEPVTVKGVIYVRSGSSNIAKNEAEAALFRQERKKKKIISEDKYPEFPLHKDADGRYIFADDTATEQPATEQPVIAEPVIEQPIIEQPIIEQPVIEQPIIEQPVTEQPAAKQPATKIADFSHIRTASVRINPLSPKHLGYTQAHRFVSVIEGGLIGISKNQNRGTWMKQKRRQLIFSITPNSKAKEDRLVSVFTTGCVGISSIKQFDDKNIDKLHPFHTENDEQIIFVAPANRDQGLLLVLEDKANQRKFFRTIPLSKYTCSNSLAAKLECVSDPEKFRILHADLIDKDDMKKQNFTDNFETHQGGKYWTNASGQNAEEAAYLKDKYSIPEFE